MDRTVIGHIPLSLDGRVSGPGGEHDMGWTVRHALTGEARAQLLKVTGPATTVLLDGRTYQGFGGFWPAVAGDEDADPRDRLFARWLNEAEKIVVSRTVTEPGWRNTRVTADDPAEIVRRLRKEEGGDIVVLASPGVIRRRSRPASWTGSASPCARKSSARAPACSATARRARPGRWPRRHRPAAGRCACVTTSSGPRPTGDFPLPRTSRP